MAQAGIYTIKAPNGEVYVGASMNIKKRWGIHRYYYNKRGRINKNLLKSFDAHGYHNHKFEIINELPLDVDRSVLDTYEQLYIQQFRDCGIPIFNIQSGGKNCKYTEESNLENSKKRKQYFKDNPDAAKKQSQRIILRYINNPEARINNSNAQKKYNTNPEAIELKRKLGKQYYENNPQVAIKHSEFMKEYFKSESGKLCVERKSKKVVCIETGIIYCSGKESARQLNLSQGNIHLVCSGKRNSTNGLTFKFHTDE